MAQTIDRIPMLAVDLIADLDATFPARCISENERPEAAHRYAGKRELVDFLLDRMKRSESNILKR